MHWAIGSERPVSLGREGPSRWSAGWREARTAAGLMASRPPASGWSCGVVGPMAGPDAGPGCSPVCGRCPPPASASRTGPAARCPTEHKKAFFSCPPPARDL